MTRTLFRAIPLAAALIATPAAAADLYYGKAPAYAARRSMATTGTAPMWA